MTYPPILIFKALSDPTRVRIIWLLLAEGELCVCDLMAVLDLPQSTVFRHLAYLRNADLVNDQRKGVWMYYRLPDQMNNLVTDILNVLASSAKEETQADLDRQRLAGYLDSRDAGACSKMNQGE